MAESRQSFRAQILLSVGGVAANTFVPLGLERDVTLTQEHAEADSTTRAGLGEVTQEPTLRSRSVEFEILSDPSDAGYQALRDAFEDREVIGVRILDLEDGEGLEADMKVFNFSRNEALAENVMMNVSLKPCRSGTASNWIGGS